MTSVVEYVQSGYWVNSYAVGDGWVSINSEIQSIAPSAIIELFELQLSTAIQGCNTIYRFHAGTNATGSNGNVVWAGNTYTAFPIEADGFAYEGNGQLPRPKIRVSNILGTITAIMLSTPLEGSKVTRIRTMARYLDNANWPGGVSPYAVDPSYPEFPREVYYIDRKSAETRDVVEFELCAAFDLIGVRAPKRQCISNICQWVYRGTSGECGYDPVGTQSSKLRDHYANSGYFENRNINSSGQFNATYYLATYPDVAAVYTLATANQHFRTNGIIEGRSGNAGGQFNPTYYLSTYSDLNVLVYFDENDNGVSNPASDVCGKRLSSCKARFGTNSVLNFGSFPGVGGAFY
jgi:lambda family phage minor tail protein L